MSWKVLWSSCKYQTMKSNIVRQLAASRPLNCLTEKRFVHTTEGLNQCVDWKKRFEYSRGNLNHWSEKLCVCVCWRVCVCVCVEGELGSVIWSLWTDSFRQEITAICVAVSGGWYSPCRLQSGAHTRGCLHSHRRDWFISRLNYWSVAVVRSAGRRVHRRDDKTSLISVTLWARVSDLVCFCKKRRGVCTNRMSSAFDATESIAPTED